MKSNKQRNYFVKVHRPLSRRHQQQRIHLIWVIVLLFWLIQGHNFLLWYDLLKGLLESDSQLLIREFATIFILSSTFTRLWFVRSHFFTHFIFYFFVYSIHAAIYFLCVHTCIVLLFLYFFFSYILFFYLCVHTTIVVDILFCCDVYIILLY